MTAKEKLIALYGKDYEKRIREEFKKWKELLRPYGTRSAMS